MIILITVPHAACPASREDHFCDYGAVRAALRLERHLQKCAKLHVHFGNVDRRICDLNRRQCYHHPWRSAIRSQFPKASLLLDVHSFPPDIDWGEYDVVLLDHAPDSEKLFNWTYEFAQALTQAGFHIGVFKGAKNDITIDALAHDVREVFLIEFNEALSDRDLDRLTMEMSRTLCR